MSSTIYQVYDTRFPFYVTVRGFATISEMEKYINTHPDKQYLAYYKDSVG